MSTEKKQREGKKAELIDAYGRTMDYLRLSITDRCNLHCLYCRPGDPYVESNAKTAGDSRRDWVAALSVEEILRLCRIFAQLGIATIKVTGGEPLLRPGAVELIGRLKGLEGIGKVTLTTNGLLLREAVDELAAAGVDGINVSVDTFVPQRYAQITGLKNGEMALKIVCDGIHLAMDRGIPLKINTVLMPGINGEELEPFVRLAEKQPLSVRFIEMMPMGEGSRFRTVPTEDLLKRIGEMTPGFHQIADNLGNGPAEYYRGDGWKGQVGVIHAVTQPFCSGCNRIRMTADGKLRLCLAHEDGIDLGQMVRDKQTDQEIREAIIRAVKRKPARHGFGSRGESGSGAGCGDSGQRAMWRIGG